MNAVADKVVPLVTEAAQTVQAMSMISMFDPERAGAYAAKVAKQKTGKDLSAQDFETAQEIARNLSDVVKAASTLELQLESVKQENERLISENESIQQALKKGNTALSRAKAALKVLRDSRPRKTATRTATLKEIAARESDILERLNAAFGTDAADILKQSLFDASANTETDTLPLKQAINPLDNDLVDIAALWLHRNRSKYPPGEFIDRMNALTNQQLSYDELRTLHYAAMHKLKGKPTADKAAAAAVRRNIAQHQKLAREYESDLISSVIGEQTTAEKRDTFLERLAAISADKNISEEVFEYAVLRHNNPNDIEGNAAKFREMHPDLDAAARRQVMIDAATLYNETKADLKRIFLSNKENVAINEADAKRIVEMQNLNSKHKAKETRRANAFYKSLGMSKAEVVLEGLVNWRRAALLTGPKTHLRNIVSNAVYAATEEASRVPAWFADRIASLATGERTVQGVSPAAIAKGFRSLVKADETFQNLNKESGIQAAWRILRHGASIEEMEQQQHSESVIGHKFPKMAWMDSFISGTFRSLSAEDAIFKVYAFRRSLEEQAMLAAQTEFSSDRTARQKRRTELLKNPTPMMVAMADEYALQATFQNDNAISNWWSKVKNTHKVVKYAGETLVPYDKTPTNIVLRTIESTPLGFAAAARKGYKAFSRFAPDTAFKNRYGMAVQMSIEGFNSLPAAERAKLLDEGLQKAFTRQQQRDFARIFGRATTGTALMTLGYLLAQAGLLAGVLEPDDDDRTATNLFFERKGQGIENRSLKVPGVGRFVLTDDPQMRALTAGATMFEQMQLSKKNNVLQTTDGVISSAWNLASDQPLIDSSGNVFKKIKGGKFGEVSGNIIGGYMPSLLSDVGEVIDPMARTSSGYVKGQDRKNLKGELEFQGRGLRNTVMRRIPIARQFTVPESTLIPQDERGDFLRRAIRMFDITNARSIRTQGDDVVRRKKQNARK